MQAKQTAQQYKIIALGLDAFMVVWLSFELWMVLDLHPRMRNR
jgi:hypothetical protein